MSIRHAYEAWQRGNQQKTGSESRDMLAAYRAGHQNIPSNVVIQNEHLLQAYEALRKLANRNDVGSHAWNHDMGALDSKVRKEIEQINGELS